MKLRKLICIALALLLGICMLTACNGTDTGDDGTQSAPAPTEPDGGAPSLPEAQKQIRTVWLEAETKDLDGLLAIVEARIAELGGYVESRKVFNGSQELKENRYANLTVRIPAEKLDKFVDRVTENARITASREDTENVALSYVALQSRVVALQTEEARLLELLATTSDVEEILKVEQRLTQVRTELEEANSQLELYDDLVDYGTVYLSMTQPAPAEAPAQAESLWSRITGGFMKSLKGMQELFVLAATILPYLLALAVLALVVYLIRRKKKK